MVERLLYLCQLKRTNFKQVEKELGMGNGSLAKSDVNIRADRLKALADYFGVSMRYLLTGEDGTYHEPYPFEHDQDFMTHILKLWNLPKEKQNSVYEIIELQDMKDQKDKAEQRKKENATA